MKTSILNFKQHLFLFSLLFVCFSPNFYSGEVIGKIIPKPEADMLFGPVITSVEFPAAQVRDWLNSSNDYILFSIKDNRLYVLTNTRAVIYPSTEFVQASDVFHVYSISKVVELLSIGGKGSVSFEVRKSVFSITMGNETLEYGTFCPPLCK
ncbi:MAG: hypothetical protein HYV28_18765 [Ignavibacteriales bacterium]|nr:hypothetical protein [Ignavibacteriales bacterium]